MPEHAPCPSRSGDLIHLRDQLIDVLLAIAQIAALDEVLELPRAEAAGGIAQLEGPEEVGGLLEIGADGEDLVDEVLDAHEAVFAQVVLDQLVVGEGDALLGDLAVPALVDERAHRFERRVPVRDVRFDDLEHFARGFGHAHEDAVVDLEEAQQLQDFARFGRDFVYTCPEGGLVGVVKTEWAGLGGEGWFGHTL